MILLFPKFPDFPDIPRPWMDNEDDIGDED